MIFILTPDANSVDAIAFTYLFLHVLPVLSAKLRLDGRDKRNLQDAILSYLISDANLICLTCRVGQWLVDTYRVGRLALS